MIKNKNTKLLSILMLGTIVASITYLSIFVDMRFLDYVMSLRIPKLLTMSIAAFCIGTASIAFQTVINNTIVTPSLLGMNSLYSLIHTSIVFILGSSSIFVTSKNLSFSIDLILMGVIATFIYGFLFKKTKYNVLYVLLIGTVMATFFNSITSSLIRVMDPNEYMALQDSLIASFHNVNSSIILLSLGVIVAVITFLRKDIQLLDVIILGKSQAINLGVDYDKVVQRLLLGVTLFIAIATALVGPISFLGLIIANIARQLFKTYKHTYLMLGSALIGILTLVVGQTFIEHILSYSTNISVFINIFGGIYFLYLILKNQKR